MATTNRIALFMAPNRLDATYYPVVLSGGNWLPALPLENLRDPILANKARSVDAHPSSTWFDVDLGIARDIIGGACPGGNASRLATARLRGSNTPAFAGCVVNANTAAGAATVVFSAAGGATTVPTGAAFTLPGDTTVYTISSGASLAAGGTASVAISPSLAVPAAAGEAVTCHTPDLSPANVLFDSGYTDWWQTMYSFGTLPFGHPSWFDGKMTDEQAAASTLPWCSVNATLIIAQYWRFEVVDPSNPQGYVELPRFFLTPGYQSSIGMDLGASLSWEDATQSERSLGGVDFYDVVDGRRVVVFTFTDLPEDEALEWPFELQGLLGTHEQIFFMWDPTDTTHLHRRSFVGTIRKLSPIGFSYFATAPFEIAEVIGA